MAQATMSSKWGFWLWNTGWYISCKLSGQQSGVIELVANQESTADWLWNLIWGRMCVRTLCHNVLL